MKPRSTKLVTILQGLYADEVRAEAQYRSHASTALRLGLPKLDAQFTERAVDESKHRRLCT